MSDSMNLMKKTLISRHVNLLSYALICAIFYVMAYYSVSALLPSSIPAHHDDYANYALASGGLTWSWNRPLSTWAIYIFSSMGPEYLSWAVRIFTATYVFLCWKILVQVLQPRQYWITLVLFAVASLSSPIVAEYARYTGMVTHMMSGCLGLAAVYFVFKDDRETSNVWLYASVALLLLSTLAKEDFILFYAFSFAYILIRSKNPVKKRIIVGLIGLAASLLMVAGAKFLAASSFLGENDVHSPYFIDISVTSVAATVWRYLTGTGHSTMIGHGRIVAAAIVFSGIVALYVLVRDKQIPKTLYIVGAALTLIAPYSVLPNHVNPYYELIWLPFIIGGVYVALTELLKINSANSISAYVTCALLATITILLYVVDTPGRSAIANWYNVIALDNTRVLKQLDENKTVINAAPSVCVYGAGAFSPWYMHSGQYLDTVMGLHTVWNIVVDKNSPLYPGFQLGANSSHGKVVVTDEADVNASCIKISIAEAK
jgi:hypothetical protein